MPTLDAGLERRVGVTRHTPPDIMIARLDFRDQARMDYCRKEISRSTNLNRIVDVQPVRCIELLASSGLGIRIITLTRFPSDLDPHPYALLTCRDYFVVLSWRIRRDPDQ